MRLLCPECGSEEVGPHRDPRAAELRCADCGADFDREEAHVTVAEAESGPSGRVVEKLFEFDADEARAQLVDPDGAIHIVGPDTDAEELGSLLWLAHEEGIIRSSRPRAAIRAHTLSAWSSRPLLVVDPGGGPTLLGPELKLDSSYGEAPVAFTVRILEEMVAEANGLAAGRAADGERLDRIAAFLNADGQWNGGDVCEFVAEELAAGGRRLLDADE